VLASTGRQPSRTSGGGRQVMKTNMKTLLDMLNVILVGGFNPSEKY
jgi:hypothetical protein